MSRVLASATTILLALTFAVAQGADDGVKCSTAKQKAAAKKIGATLKCHQKAAADAVPVDPECLAKVDAKFSEAIAKAEARGGCIVTGDEAALDQACDECVDGIRGLTPTAPPTCGEGTFPQCGGTCPLGQSCQAFIVDSLSCVQGQGQSTTCSSYCACVDPTLACNGQACGRICHRKTRDTQCGGSPLTESCCGDFGGRCNATTGNPACCCAGACFDPPFGNNASCIQSIACNATRTASVCQ